MRTPIKYLLFVLLSLFISYDSYSEPLEQIGLVFESFDSNYQPNGNNRSGYAPFDAILDEFDVTVFEVAFPGAVTPRVQNSFRMILPNPDNYDELLSVLSTIPSIENPLILTEQTYLELTDPPITTQSAIGTCEDPYEYDDPNALVSYHTEMMNLPCAWKITQGDQNITVAVIDIFFDNSHEDLEGKIVAINGNCKPQYHICNHGYMTAGAVAANVDNGTCLAGSGNKTTVAGYCVGGSGCRFGIPAPGAWQAYLDGYKIINLSWLSTTLTKAQVEEMTMVGGVTLTLCGYGDGHSRYADVPGVINVGMVNSQRNYRVYDTNLGFDNRIDIYSPAVWVHRLQALNDCGAGWGLNSFAAPSVAGVIALMKSENDCLTPMDIETIIKESHQGLPLNADDPGDPWYGQIDNGIIDAYNAVLMAQNYQGTDEFIDTDMVIGDRMITGAMTIATGTEVNIVGTVMFGNAGRIIVQRGARLIVDGGTLTRMDCAQEWKGIFVEGNSVNPDTDPNDIGKTFVEQPTDPYTSLNPDQCGILILKHGAVVEYAEIAIRMHNTHYFWPDINDYWGGLVYADNAYFRHGTRAAAFMKYGTATHPERSQFIGCEFDKFQSGITNWSSNGLTIEFCKFTDFEKSAIVSIDAQINVLDRTNITGVENSGINRGIYLVNTHPHVLGSNIGSFTTTGANIFSGGDYNVHSVADMSAEKTSFENNLMSGATFGIYQDGISFYSVIDNEFDHHTYNSIFLANGDQGNEFRDNLVENSAIGTYSINDNAGFTFSNNCYDENSYASFLITGRFAHERGSIAPNQGMAGGASAGNCFETPANRRIRTFQSFIDPFTYHILRDEETSSCRHPVISNALWDIADDAVLNDVLVCGIPQFGEGSSSCEIPESEALILEAISSFEGPDACLRKLKGALLALYAVEDRKTDLLNYFETESDFLTRCLVFGYLMEILDYSEASSYLDSSIVETSEESDFVAIQKININRLVDGDNYVVSTEDLNLLDSIADKGMPLSAFARGLWYVLTDEIRMLEIEFPNENPLKKGLLPRLEPKIEVYPSPVKDQLYIKLQNARSEGEIQIFDIHGRLIRSVAVTPNTESLDILVEEWTSGIYVVHWQITEPEQTLNLALKFIKF